MEYEDFILQLNRAPGGGYLVSVISSPAGEGESPFRPPFGEDDNPAIFRGMTPRDLLPPEEEVAASLTPREVGSRLFEALFTGEVRQLYDQSRGALKSAPGRGLRIKLKLNPRHPDLARIHGLPWELLHQPEVREFLTLSRRSPVVRYLDVPQPAVTSPLPAPLRILVVIASPRGLRPLDLERERKNIAAALGNEPAFETTFLEKADVGSLRNVLLETPFSVLHFMGHGAFDQDHGKGLLYFESPEGDPLPTSGEDLAALLSDFSHLRLVLLNACHSARMSSVSELNPFAGVASALLLGGLSAVVAMQFPISDQAAIRFSSAFYRRLGSGDPIDAAVTEGRHAIRAADPESMEWATPVLFMRLPQGRIWKAPSHAPATTRPEPPAVDRPTLGKRLWRMRSLILGVLTVCVWLGIRLEANPPSTVYAVLLTDESTEVQGLEKINNYPIPLAPLANLIGAITRHQPLALAIDVYLSEGDENEAEELENVLLEAQTRFVLPRSDDQHVPSRFLDVCEELRNRGNLCREASVEVIEQLFTVGSELDHENRPLFLTLAGKSFPRIASRAIMPIDAYRRMEEAVVEVAPQVFMSGYEGKVEGQHVILGGVLAKDRNEKIMDRHTLPMPFWHRGHRRYMSGSELQALMTGYALSDGLLWIVGGFYVLPLAVLGLLLGWVWRRETAFWLAFSHLVAAVALRTVSHCVLPLWPVWLLAALHIGTRRFK